MKVTHISDPVPFEKDDLPVEMTIDYSQTEPNPYAARFPGLAFVALDADIAAAFKTPEEVNAALRTLIPTAP